MTLSQAEIDFLKMAVIKHVVTCTQEEAKALDEHNIEAALYWKNKGEVGINLFNRLHKENDADLRRNGPQND